MMEHRLRWGYKSVYNILYIAAIYRYWQYQYWFLTSCNINIEHQSDLYPWDPIPGPWLRVTGHFENPAISRDSNIEDQCPPPCKSFTFSIEQVTVCLDS